jgi:hypothetical protein
MSPCNRGRRSVSPDRLPHLFAGLGQNRLFDALVARVRRAPDQAQALQLGELPAHGGVIASDDVSQFDHPDRAVEPDADEQGKQRAIQRNARLLQDALVRLRPRQNAHQIHQSVVKLILLPCILHTIPLAFPVQRY